MLLVGILVGLPASVIAMKIWFFILKKGFWQKDKDEITVDTRESYQSIDTNKKLPKPLIAFIPLLIPIFCILLGTTYSVITGGEVPKIIALLGNKIVAMLLGAIAAYITSIPYLTKEEREEAVLLGMTATGLCLLVTGAGGSFGSVYS